MAGLFDAIVVAAASDPWADKFFGLDQGQRFVVLLTAIGCATGLLISLAGILYSALDAAHRRKVEADLKREMLDRGMTADEVVKVVESATPLEDATSRWIESWCKHKNRKGC